MTVEQVVDAITNDNGEHFDLDIVAYARQYILHLKETGHTGNALSYQVAINNLVRFVGRDSVSIKEITVKFVNDWIKWIKRESGTFQTRSQSRRKGTEPIYIPAKSHTQPSKERV